MLRRLLFAFCLTIPGATLAQTVPDSVTPARVLQGSALFNGGTCIGCHAVGGVGHGNRAPDLSDVEWLHNKGDFDGILNTIFWGVPRDRIKALTPRPSEMHPRGGMNVSYDELKSIAAYVWSISRPNTHPLVKTQAQFLAMIRAGDTIRARELFTRWSRDSGQPLLPNQALEDIGFRIPK